MLLKEKKRNKESKEKLDSNKIMNDPNMSLLKKYLSDK